MARKQSIQTDPEQTLANAKETAAIITAEEQRKEAYAKARAENEAEEAEEVEVEATSADDAEAPETEHANGSGGSERHKKWRQGTDKVKKFFSKVAEYSIDNKDVERNWQALVRAVKLHEQGTTSRQEKYLSMLEDL